MYCKISHFSLQGKEKNVKHPNLKATGEEHSHTECAYRSQTLAASQGLVVMAQLEGPGLSHSHEFQAWIGQMIGGEVEQTLKATRIWETNRSLHMIHSRPAEPGLQVAGSALLCQQCWGPTYGLYSQSHPGYTSPPAPGHGDWPPSTLCLAQVSALRGHPREAARSQEGLFSCSKGLLA